MVINADWCNARESTESGRFAPFPFFYGSGLYLSLRR
jgi:hypothetical protein